MSERHHSQLPAYPQLRWDWEQCQQQCNLRAYTKGKRWHNRTHSQVNSSRGGILSGFSPSASASNPPTLHLRSKTQWRNRFGGLYSNNQGTDPTPDWAVTTTEQRRGPAQYPEKALVSTTQVKPPIKKIMTKTTWSTSPTRGRHQKQEKLLSCSMWKGNHKYSKLDKMRWKRNMLQTQEQDKNLQEQLDEEED